MILPTWWPLAAGAALVTVIGVQQVRVANLKTDVATLEQVAARDDAARQKAARLDADEKRALQAQHAAQQQENTDAFTIKLTALQAARAADASTVVGLRRDLASYAARGGRAGETDAARASRAEDRLAALAGLLDQGIGLVGESRGVVGQRDAEVAVLLQQIHIDRRACSTGNNPE